MRLRFINASTSTYFNVMIDGHPLLITHADGPAVRPVEVDWVQMATAECYDVLFTMTDETATIHAQPLGGTGQAIGVLHAPGTVPESQSRHAQVRAATALLPTARGARDHGERGQAGSGL